MVIRMRLVLKGNSIMEYALPLVIVGAVLIASTYSLAPGVKNSLLGSMSSSDVSGGNVKVRRLGQNPYLQDIKLVLADGTVLTLTDYPMDLGKAVEVDGVDGTTAHLSEAVLRLAKQLRDSGKITDAQFNRLANLSNIGHRLGEISRELQAEADASGGDRDKFSSSTITIDGQNFNTYEMALAMGERGLDNDPIFYDFDTIKTADLNQYEGLMGDEQLALWKELQNVSQSGALSDPTINQVVNNLTVQIAELTRITASATHNAATGVDGATPATMQNIQTDLAIHAKSTGICQAGGGQDTGIHCPKI